MGYTKGPWGIRETMFALCENYEITFNDDGECVAEVVHEKDDANLIAAAPEMYEALKLMVEGFAYEQPNDHDYALAMSTAMEALAKARGE